MSQYLHGYFFSFLIFFFFLLLGFFLCFFPISVFILPCFIIITVILDCCLCSNERAKSIDFDGWGSEDDLREVEGGENMKIYIV